MTCPKCGNKIAEGLEVYCPFCGGYIKTTSKEQEKSLQEQARVEHDRQMFQTLLKRLFQAAALLVALLILKSAVRVVAHDELSVFFPPAGIEISVSHAERFEIMPEKLRVQHRPPVAQRRAVAGNERDIIRNLLHKNLEQAPKYRLDGDRIIQGFIYSQGGGRVEIITREGMRSYAENSIEKVN